MASPHRAAAQDNDLQGDPPAFHQLASCSQIAAYLETHCPARFNARTDYVIDFEQPAKTADNTRSFQTNNIAFKLDGLRLDGVLLDSDLFAVGGRLSYWPQATTVPYSAQTDPASFAVDLNVSYQFSHGPLNFAPGGRLIYSQMEPLSPTDSKQSASTDDLSALTLSFGGQISYDLKQNWGFLMPFASVQWTHEIDTDYSTSGGRLINDLAGQPLQLQSAPALSKTLDRDYFNLGVGFSAEFNNGAAAFMNYQQLLGHDELQDFRVNAGFKLDF
jgi:uncharacterized protein YhjY with autotransporter beta-barrel domain